MKPLNEIVWEPENRFFKESPKFIILHGISEFLRDDNGDFGPREKEYHFSEFLDSVGYSYHGFFDNGEFRQGQSFDKVAWHAGVSEIEGYRWLNYRSLGFAFIIPGLNPYFQFVRKMEEPDTYPNQQYAIASKIIAEKCKELDLDETKIYGHDQVADDSVRGKGKGKKDPGIGFDNIRLKMMVKAILEND